jgi:hypothetical protein
MPRRSAAQKIICAEKGCFDEFPKVRPHATVGNGQLHHRRRNKSPPPPAKATALFAMAALMMLARVAVIDSAREGR